LLPSFQNCFCLLSSTTPPPSWEISKTLHTTKVAHLEGVRINYGHPITITTAIVIVVLVILAGMLAFREEKRRLHEERIWEAKRGRAEHRNP
jgi:hypothetical protein